MDRVTVVVDSNAVLSNFTVMPAGNRRYLPTHKTRLFQVASYGLQPNEVRRRLDHFVKVNVGLVIAHEL